MARALPISSRRRSGAGFTLIELLIVVIIIGILMAIGVPAYLKYVASAKDRDAQVALRTAYKAAVAGDTEVNSSRFPVASTIVQDIQADEPGFSVARGSCLSGIGGASTKQVLVDPASTASTIVMCIPSASGAVWKLTGPLTGDPTVTDASTVALTISASAITDSTRAAKIQGDGRSNDSSTGLWDASTNYVLNGGFETNNAHWVTTGGVSTAVDSGVSMFGNSSLRITTTSGGGVWGGGAAAGSASLSQIAITAGQTYTASAWVKAGAGASMKLQLEWYDGSTFATNTTSYTGTGAWQRVSLTATAPAGKTWVDITNYTNDNVQTFWVDGVQLEQRGYATPYIETNGATTTRTTSTVQAPAGLLTETQGWIAMRVRMDYPNTQGPIGLPLFTWTSLDSHNKFVLFNQTNQTGGIKLFENTRNSVASTLAASQTWNAGDMFTLVAYWTDTQVGVSVNGGAFITHARTAAGGTALQPTFNIGTSEFGNAPGEDVFWFACGTGTVSSADAAAINGWGNADPKRSSFAAATQASMVWDGVSTTGSLK